MVRALTDRPLRRERRIKMTYEEYLENVDESAHAEWVDGEATIFMPPGDPHQDISGFLGALLRYFLRAYDLGVVRNAPFEMKLRSGRSYREPDLLVITKDHLERLTPTRLDGPADLIVEIVSPDSVGRDRRDKFREYEDAGIPEYWTIDARAGRRGIACFALSADGHYVQVLPDDAGRLHSAVLPGFWLDVAWFTGDALPDEIAVLRALAPAVFGS